MENIPKLRLEKVIANAEAVKLDLRIKIAEREDDVRRMREHMALQEKQIEKSRENLSHLGE